MKKLVALRRFSQVFFSVVFVYILWSTTYPLTGLFSPAIIFKIDPLVMGMTALSERILLPGLVFSGLMILATLVLGRFFCGWVCPLGTFSDALAAVRRKKNLLSDTANRRIKTVKFWLLGIAVLFAFAGIQIAWVFDPLVIAARFVSLNLIPAVTYALDQYLIWFIQTFAAYQSPVYDFYRSLKDSFLGVQVYDFSNGGVILAFFLGIASLGLLLSRAWCRVLCPLGAIYALAAGSAWLERSVGDCAGCRRCAKSCRMGAIRDDMSYSKGECILCMDCVYDCPKHETRFAWRRRKDVTRPVSKPGPGTVSRKDFLALLGASLSFFSLGFRPALNPGGRLLFSARGVIRPPGALSEKEFVDRCIRCGNCMKVCITNGLQPVLMESGWEGLWTPQLVPEIGYCEHECTLCGQTCPTGAIPVLDAETKKRTRLGLAVIDKSACIAWARHEECIVCEEHCPVADKAIKLIGVDEEGVRVVKPRVDPRLCVGCGICQKVCPVRPVRAIRVRPVLR